MPLARPVPKRQNVLIICNSYPPERGGAPTRIHNLALLLRDAGYNITVLTAMPNYPAGTIWPAWRGKLLSTDVEEGITVKRLWLLPSNSSNLMLRGISMASGMLSLFLLGGLRIVFASWRLIILSSPPLPQAFAGMLLARLGRKKTLLNVSDLWPQTFATLGVVKPRLLYRCMETMEKLLYKLAHAHSGQSQEIMNRMTAVSTRPSFKYLNLQAAQKLKECISKPKKIRIVYAGLLGIAQGLLPLCEAIDFQHLNTELHIYGDGRQRALLSTFLHKHPNRGIYLHPTIPAQDIPEMLCGFNVVLVPLVKPLEGAVPSKIFMAIANAIPVLYSGDGEAADLIIQSGIGFTAPAGNYEVLRERIIAFANLSEEAHSELRTACISAREGAYNKSIQDKRFVDFLQKIIG